MSSTLKPADIARHFYTASTSAISHAATEEGDPLFNLRRLLGSRFAALATAALAEVGPPLIVYVEAHGSAFRPALENAVKVGVARVKSSLLEDLARDAGAVSPGVSW